MLPSRRRSTVLATVTVAASALLLSACGSSSDSASSSPSSSASASTSSSGSSGSSAGSTGSGSTSGGVGAGTVADSTGKPNAVSSSVSAGTERCHTKDLAISFETGGDAAPDRSSDQQQRTGIAVRNNSGHTCVVGGFPGVDLAGGSVTWSLTREAASYHMITLHPGDTTDFSITFQPEPNGKWTPKTVTVTPPNETTSATLTWPWGPVLLQDGATHPGTYVGPIG